MNQGRRAISKAMMYLLELLLRLRQCADHIYLYLICNLDARKEDPDFDWRQYIDEIQYRFKNMIEDLKSGKNSVFTNTLNLVMNTKLCYICNDELSPEYLQTKCNHTFCDCCVGESIYLNNECPFCNTKLNSSEIIRHISNKKVVYDDSSDLDISMSGDSFIERDENEKKKSEQRKKNRKRKKKGKKGKKDDKKDDKKEIMILDDDEQETKEIKEIKENNPNDIHNTKVKENINKENIDTKT